MQIMETQTMEEVKKIIVAGLPGLMNPDSENLVVISKAA
ncbi:MAG: hypothetical protein QG552_270 [Thermodesulfobacteriota bacterium]|nr:hypothetical protein [Thermodesulfobacteriota bacterium]